MIEIIVTVAMAREIGFLLGYLLLRTETFKSQRNGRARGDAGSYSNKAALFLNYKCETWPEVQSADAFVAKHK